MGTFWRFGLAQESTLESLLKGWDASAPSPTLSPTRGPELNGGIGASTISDTGEGTSTAARPNTLTLEQLLDEDDLLQECKSGHAKLVSQRHQRLYLTNTNTCMTLTPPSASFLAYRQSSCRAIMRSSGCWLTYPAKLSVPYQSYHTKIYHRLYLRRTMDCLALALLQ